MSDEEDSIKILKRRYAKGDITEKTYLETKKNLEDVKEDYHKENVSQRQTKPQKSSNKKYIIVAAILIIGFLVLFFGWYYPTFLNWYTPSCYYTNTCTTAPVCPTGFMVVNNGSGYSSRCKLDVSYIANLLTGSSHLNLTQADITFLENCYTNYTQGKSLSNTCIPIASCPNGYGQITSGGGSYPNFTINTCILNTMCGQPPYGFNLNPPRCHPE